MKNKYEIRGDEVIIFLNHKGEVLETRISLNKLERAMEFTGAWCATWAKKSNSFYVRGNVYKGSQRTSVQLHTWLVPAPDGHTVDHFDNDTLNNTDENLRACTLAENCQNRKGAYSNSQSGIRGVRRKKNRWEARLRTKGKYVYLGLFPSAEEAEFAVKFARAELMPFSKEATYANAPY